MQSLDHHVEPLSLIDFLLNFIWEKEKLLKGNLMDRSQQIQIDDFKFDKRFDEYIFYKEVLF